MTTKADRRPATFESVWELLRELTLSQAETAREIEQVNKTAADRQAETAREIEKIAREIEQVNKIAADRQAEVDRQIEKTAREVEKVNKTVGSWANNQGSFAEEYFYNSFENGEQNFFGEKFDAIKKNLKGAETNDEFDIVLVNGQSVGLVEVKFKAHHEKDIPKVLKKVDAFRTNFPKYQNHKIYLGLATMVFYPELEKDCIENGIAVIKQVGDTVVINDEGLKAF
jgi:hypothetical protein